MAANSLDILSLGSDKPEFCALLGCDLIALNFPCKKCCTAPNPDFSGINLDDVRYCSDPHRAVDAETHSETCKNRQWLRDGKRIGEMSHELFVVAMKEMYPWVVLNHEGNSTVRYFNFKDCDKPAAEEPFWGPDETDPELELCAHSLLGCVYAVRLSSPFLAYMTKDSQFRIKELDIRVKPRTLIFLNGEILITYLHTLFSLSPSYLPGATWEHIEDGIILDASAAQMGWLDEYVMRTKIMGLTKVDMINTEKNANLPFGHHLRRHQAEMRDTSLEMLERKIKLQEELTFRAVNNVLFSELEKLGGAKKILDLEYAEWEQAKQDFIERIKQELKRLRIKLEEINFGPETDGKGSDDKGSDDKKTEDNEKDDKMKMADKVKLAKMESLLQDNDGQGYKEMMKVFNEAADEAMKAFNELAS